jgi:predicted RNA binding protein YcfA (HicA-like mRNA interferase family)
MGQRKYPPLEPGEIIAILAARGYRLDRTRGDHRYYTRYVNGRERVVNIDMGNPMYSKNWLQLVIEESGLDRDDFYCSTKSSAAKIGKPCASRAELSNWSALHVAHSAD